MSATTVWTRLRHALGSYPTTARDWAVRVQSSDVTRRELLALDEWLKADPKNAEAYARVNKISHLGLMLRDHPNERARLCGYAKLRAAESASCPTPANMTRVTPAKVAAQLPARWALAGAAAAIITAVALGLALIPRHPPPTQYAS